MQTLSDNSASPCPKPPKTLRSTRNKASENSVYDKSAKRYIAADEFKRVFMPPNASTFLTYLRVFNEGTSGATEAWLASAPEYDALRIPHGRVDVDALRDVLRVVRESQSIEILHQSMSASKVAPEWRRITPHALGNDGLRWHVRAFCHVVHNFKDFILSRCTKTRNQGQPGSSANDVSLWNDRFAVAGAPNPATSESQQSIIALDYKMKNGRIELMVRKAQFFFFQKHLRLDVADKPDNLHESPVVVANRAAFDVAIAGSME